MRKAIQLGITYLCILVLINTVSLAQDSVATHDPSVPKPTIANLSYGDHERHILDFWQAESATPTPLVFVIHGGGWSVGEKERLSRFANTQELLDAGISVVAINYRLKKHLEGTDVIPMVKGPNHDAARALQFVRSKAKEWNFDKDKIGAAGGSAGACTGLWLAYHDDLADPKSDDPISRESTRFACAALMGAQTSLDPKQMKEWIPNITYGGHAFGKKDFDSFLTARDSIMPWIKEYSPYWLVSSDDPPVYILYNHPPAIGKDQENATHSANFGVMLKEHCANFNIECDLKYPDAPNVIFESPTDYLVDFLTGSRGKLNE